MRQLKQGIRGDVSVIYWHHGVGGFMYLKLEDNEKYKEGLIQLGDDVFVGKIKSFRKGNKIVAGSKKNCIH